jgi:energy-coupling factor transporter ATP-binding protein EcfA2
LVDEPDSHVHPSSQKMLMVALERIASELGCRIILSTHSRHVVSAAPDNAAIVWMKDGAVFNKVDRDVIPLLIDLGALDQFDMDADVLMATEDEDTAMLEGTIAGISGARRIKLVSFNGLSNATSAQAFDSISKLVKHGPTVAIHRDRDFITDEELTTWSQPYLDNGIQVFCPKYCDMESYYATASHLAQVTGMSIAEAEALRSNVIHEHLDEFRAKFETKRQFANGKLWATGGRPTNDSLWDAGDPPPEEFLYGKLLLRLVKAELKRDPIRRSASALEKVPSKELIEELRLFLDGLD